MKIAIINDIEDLNRISKLNDNNNHLIFADITKQHGIIVDVVDAEEVAMVFRLYDTSNNMTIAAIEKFLLEVSNHLCSNIDKKKIVFFDMKEATRSAQLKCVSNMEDLKIIATLNNQTDFLNTINKLDNYCDFITFVESRAKIYNQSKQYLNSDFKADIKHILYNSIPAYVEMESKGFQFDDKIKDMIKGQDVRGNRVYFSYNLLGTITGRASSKIHPLSKDIKKGIYPGKNKVFVNFDYNAAEARILAHYSDDDNLIDIFKQDQDLHKINAALMFDKKDESEIDVQERTISKLVFFSIMNGVSSNTLARDLKKFKITEDTTRKTKAAIQKIYSKAVEWISRIQSDAIAKKQITNMFGRVRYLDKEIIEDESRANKQASNFMMQSTLSDIKLLALHAIKEKYRGIIAAEFHDAILVELDFDNNINVIIKDILSIMSNIGVRYDFKCPLKASFEIQKHL